MAAIVSINLSPGGIPKLPVASASVTVDGLHGDGHDHAKHRVPEQAISLIDLELLDAAGTDHGLDLAPGSLGENLTVRGLGVQRLGEGDRLHIAGADRDPGGVVLEITRVRPPCYVLDALSPDLKRTMWNRIGMYARVVVPGTIREGDAVEIELVDEPIARPLLREPKAPGVDGRSRAETILDAAGLPPIGAER